MSICPGIVTAVTLHQVDSAPDGETGAESDHKSLQYLDCAVEKCHKASYLLWFCDIDGLQTEKKKLLKSSFRYAVCKTPPDVTVPVPDLVF